MNNLLKNLKNALLSIKSTLLTAALVKKSVFIAFLAFASIAASPIALAEDEEEGEESEEVEVIPLMYFDIDPKVLTFYQGTGRKIGYVVVQINIAVKGQENLDLVELHSPLIQDNLIDFFNRQDKKTIQDFSEREGLRQKAQESVAAVLEEEVGKNIIESLLFTDYVYQ